MTECTICVYRSFFSNSLVYSIVVFTMLRPNRLLQCNERLLFNHHLTELVLFFCRFFCIGVCVCVLLVYTHVTQVTYMYEHKWVGMDEMERKKTFAELFFYSSAIFHVAVNILTRTSLCA